MRRGDPFTTETLDWFWLFLGRSVEAADSLSSIVIGALERDCENAGNSFPVGSSNDFVAVDVMYIRQAERFARCACERDHIGRTSDSRGESRRAGKATAGISFQQEAGTSKCIGRVITGSS
jgi:hypothetical protein